MHGLRERFDHARSHTACNFVSPAHGLGENRVQVGPFGAHDRHHRVQIHRRWNIRKKLSQTGDAACTYSRKRTGRRTRLQVGAVERKLDPTVFDPSYCDQSERSLSVGIVKSVSADIRARGKRGQCLLQNRLGSCPCSRGGLDQAIGSKPIDHRLQPIHTRCQGCDLGEQISLECHRIPSIGTQNPDRRCVCYELLCNSERRNPDTFLGDIPGIGANPTGYTPTNIGIMSRGGQPSQRTPG